MNPKLAMDHTGSHEVSPYNRAGNTRLFIIFKRATNLYIEGVCDLVVSVSPPLFRHAD